MEQLALPLLVLAFAILGALVKHGWPTINIHKHYHNDNDNQAKK